MFCVPKLQNQLQVGGFQDFVNFGAVSNDVDFKVHKIVQTNFFISVQDLESPGYRCSINYARGKCKFWHWRGRKESACSKAL